MEPWLPALGAAVGATISWAAVIVTGRQKRTEEKEDRTAAEIRAGATQQELDALKARVTAAEKSTARLAASLEFTERLAASLESARGATVDVRVTPGERMLLGLPAEVEVSEPHEPTQK